MQSDWATENLQVIRTLMERSALYRRALAPTTLVAGLLGTLGALGGFKWAIGSGVQFCGYWLGVAAFTVAACFLVVRRQALQAGEPFWSPPMRRVVQAMSPALVFGLVLGLAVILSGADEGFVLFLVFIWIGLYGNALHAAGFFMPRGIRFFGWVVIAVSSVALIGLVLLEPDEAGLELEVANGLMGAVFGLLHLAYGVYLLATEKRRPAA